MGEGGRERRMGGGGKKRGDVEGGYKKLANKGVSPIFARDKFHEHRPTHESNLFFKIQGLFDLCTTHVQLAPNFFL